MKGPTCGLSQQAGEAEGSLTLETQGRVGSSPDNDGTGRYCQTARVRQARREGVTRVNQWLNPLKRENRLQPGGYGPGSSARASRNRAKRLRSRRISLVDREATRKACGVLVARLQGKSWAPTPSTGQW